MSVPTPYEVPPRPPAELLAELDAAVQALYELSSRAAEVSLAMDDQAQGLRIELRTPGACRSLVPSELFELLTARS